MRIPSKYRKRGVRRARSLSAWIVTIVTAGSEDRECRVIDVSKDGAKVIAPVPSQVPDRFEIRFARGAKRHRVCVVVWRRVNVIGVQFASE